MRISDIGNVQKKRRRQLMPSSLVAVDSTSKVPNPPCLAFLDFLAFLLLRFSLLLGGVFLLSFPRNLGVALPEEARKIARGKRRGNPKKERGIREVPFPLWETEARQYWRN